MLSGKNKQRFEKWYDETYRPLEDDYDLADVDSYTFSYLPPEMQKGVYEKYFESLGYNIRTDKYINAYKQVNAEWFIFKEEESKVVGSDIYTLIYTGYHITDSEAFTEAVKQLDKLINEL